MQKFVSFILAAAFTFFGLSSFAQYKTYELSIKGDTINAINMAGKKHGKWVERVEELRGEPGFEEEGEYVDGNKQGYWRKYTLEGDLLGIENYFKGGKDGAQLYYDRQGNLERQEMWRAFNPDAPYDTIDVYGSGNNEIVGQKIVKAQPYSIRHGDWKFYNTETGSVARIVKYELNREIIPKPEPVAAVEPGKKKEVKKTQAMLDWEKKNRGKKGAIRDGSTGL